MQQHKRVPSKGASRGDGELLVAMTMHIHAYKPDYLAETGGSRYARHLFGVLLTVDAVCM